MARFTAVPEWPSQRHPHELDLLGQHSQKSLLLCFLILPRYFILFHYFKNTKNILHTIEPASADAQNVF
jgi:hypothetical protein